ncbi:MAG: aminomethyl-transferring glycine dehydrogenase subunit GcvPA [Nitrospirae bacterium]|nr:aminomethyl-transferring glycine dehydrogenase subunit GcvPA [Candidatus Manganitrophaceae bacterium]
MEYIPKTAAEETAMLQEIGVTSFDQLLEIPQRLRLNRPLNLPPPLSQMELRREMVEISRKNLETGTTLSFLGGGSYDHFIPSTVGHVLSKSEFYTSYTPYQAEMSQGLLQTIYEYQTMICQLTGMEVSNASVYDGASALAEGALMAMRVTKRGKVVIARSVHPHYRQVVKTYLSGLASAQLKEVPFEAGTTELNRLAERVDDQTAAVLIQHPNFFGQLEEVEEIERLAHAHGALLVMSVDPISLGLLKTPGEYKADIAVGEGQPLGNAIGYGGPYVGFFTTRRDFIRQMPGRVVGATTDAQGRPGFCLTLQTREQHIRRERATSNICTNQALNALAASVYLATVGKEGLREVAMLSLAHAHAAQEKIAALPGFVTPFTAPFFKEFVVRLPAPASRVLNKARRAGVLAGIDLGAYYRELKNHLLICVTEKQTIAEIDRLIATLRTFETGPSTEG